MTECLLYTSTWESLLGQVVKCLNFVNKHSDLFKCKIQVSTRSWSRKRQSQPLFKTWPYSKNCYSIFKCEVDGIIVLVCSIILSFSLNQLKSKFILFLLNIAFSTHNLKANRVLTPLLFENSWKWSMPFLNNLYTRWLSDRFYKTDRPLGKL